MNDHATNVYENDRLYRQLGVRFDRKTLPEIVTTALMNINAPAFYITCNLNHLRVLQSDIEFRDAYRKATLITLDSRPIQLASRLRFGESVPLITGADLFDLLFKQLRPDKDRPFFVSSSDKTGNELSQRLLNRGFSSETVAFYTPPFGFQRNVDQSKAIAAQIREHEATHLFMGIGAPKSERWVVQYLDDLPPAHIFCVGAALDFTAGSKNRAPAWLGHLGLEWLHRLISEPSRLMPRYAGDIALFAKVLIGQKLTQVSVPATTNDAREQMIERIS